jgi:elongation factor P
VATTNDLKNGMTLDIEGQLWTVVEFQHVKPGKGPAFVRTKLKQVMTGKVVDKTFNAGVKVEVAILEKREMNFLYKEGEDFVFMDNKTFDQMNISAAIVGDAANYMLENTEAIVAINENNPLYIELPASVVLTVTYTEPGLQGDRSSGGTKPATVETGIEIQVPLFIKQDEKVLVDTRDGSYQGAGPSRATRAAAGAWRLAPRAGGGDDGGGQRAHDRARRVGVRRPAGGR